MALAQLNPITDRRRGEINVSGESSEEIGEVGFGGSAKDPGVEVKRLVDTADCGEC
jgi:hypothetical protein